MNKKPQRRVLGRGLAALIPDHPEESEQIGQAVVEIPCLSLRPNPFQPRTDIREAEIRELAESIKNQGLLQPILVRQKGNREYEIISGERRFRALKALGRDTASCVVRTNVSDREMMEIALVENIQREDLNEMEKAESFQRLLLEHRYTHEELAGRIGKSRAAVTNTLRLLNLPQEIQLMVRRNEISPGHARALLGLDNDEERIAAAKRIVAEDLSVRTIERQLQQSDRSGKPGRKKGAAGKGVDPDTAEALNRLQYKLGTAVSLRQSSDQKGRLEIEYYSLKDLTRIFEILLPATAP